MFFLMFDVLPERCAVPRFKKREGSMKKSFSEEKIALALR